MQLLTASLYCSHGLLILVLGALALRAGEASAYDVAAGSSHTCAIDNNGVTCWGDNRTGQSTVPAGLSYPTAIAAGPTHTCAIDDNGVTCWGSDYYRQSTVPSGLSHPTDIATSSGHTCAIDDNGLTCWGNNNYGQATVPEELVFETPDCDDDLDNDGDGFADFVGGDPGCAHPNDLSENDPTLPCDDGADNDSDGRIDFDPVTFADPGDKDNLPAGSGDPGCHDPLWITESPKCQDGIHNDNDGKMDYDAGFSANGTAHPAGPDSQCVGKPWVHNECGLGAELALLLPPLMWFWRRRSLH